MQHAMTKEEKQTLQQLRRTIGANLALFRQQRGYVMAMKNMPRC